MVLLHVHDAGNNEKLRCRQEPKMPYLVITDGQQYLERRERKNPPKNFMK